MEKQDDPTGLYTINEEEVDMLHIALFHSMDEKPDFWKHFEGKEQILLKELREAVYGE